MSDPLHSRFTVCSEKDGLPGEIINAEDLLVTLSEQNIKNGVYALDVSAKNIWIEGRVFVSYQVLDSNLSSELAICAGLFGKSYLRTYVENWQKVTAVIVPAINIDVKAEK